MIILRSILFNTLFYASLILQMILLSPYYFLAPRKKAFAIPMYFYDQFMRDNGFYAQVDAMLADSTFAFACNSYNKVAVAAGCSIEFLKPAHPGDVGVQGVGRLECGDGPAGTPVGQADRLEHLVGAVGREHVGGVDRSGGLGTLDLGDARSQSDRGAVRVAVPLDPRQTGGERVDERRRRRLGCLVGVEPDPDVDLR